MEEQQINYKQLYEEQKNQVIELQTKLSELTVCRRCGLPVDDKPIALSDDVKKEYFKTLLTNKPFSKEYELFDGAVRITFEVAKGELVTAQRTAINNTTNMTINTINDVLLISALAKVVTYDNDTDEVKTLYIKDAAARTDALKSLSSSIEELEQTVDFVLLACVRRTLEEFSRLVKALTDNGLDENFYKGDGLVSP